MFLPHGYCLSWNPALLWTTVGSDLVIGLSYYSIPFALLYFLRRHRDPAFNNVLWLFIIFIAACGMTHFLNIVSMWVPVYRAEASAKLLTAVTSAATALALWPLAPKAIALIEDRARSQAAQQESHRQLQASTALLLERTAQVEESERRFRTTLKNAPNGFAVIGLDGRFQMVNEALCQLVGYTENELLSLHFQDITHPDDVAADMAQMQQLLDGHIDRYRLEKRYRHKEGHEVPIQLDRVVVRDERGKPLEFVTQMQDISKRLQLERDREKLLVEAAPNAMIMVDRNGHITLANSGAERLFGYAHGELKGQPMELLVPERIRARHPQLRDRYMTQPQPRTMGLGRNLYGVTKAGHEMPLEISLNPIATSDGVQVLAAIVDITERKRMIDAIVEAEARLRLVIDAAPSAMLLVGDQGKMILVNAQAEKLFGYPRDEMLGHSVEMLVPARVRGSHAEMRSGFFGRPDARAMGAGRDLFGLRKDGIEVPIEIGLNPLKTDEGLFVLASIIDITERKRAEDMLKALNQSLAQQVSETGVALERLRSTKDQLVQSEKLASLGAMVAGIAHELNTPVGVGVTAASTLEARVVDMEERYRAGQLRRSEMDQFVDTAKESSRIILKNLQRASDLIASFKKVAVDQSSGERRPFELGGYIDEVLLSLAPRLRKSQHQVSVQCPLPVALDSYPGAIAQIITNLVNNSLTHAFPDGRVGHIRMELLNAGEQALLRYSDDGVGIPPEHRAQIYNPFFTTRRGSGGSGLGMSIVHNLVTQVLGGSIQLEEGSAVGVAFTISIPRVAATPRATG